jgi:hypothetical protein
MKGLIAQIAAKLGKSISEVKSALMRVAIAAAKQLLKEAGIEGRPGRAWFMALHLTLPVFWKVVAEKEGIPTVEEVVAAVKARVPNYAEQIRAAYARA